MNPINFIILNKMGQVGIHRTLHKKLSFPLRISSVYVTKSAGKSQICSHLLKKFLMENSFFMLWYSNRHLVSERFIFKIVFVIYQSSKKARFLTDIAVSFLRIINLCLCQYFCVNRYGRIR